LGLGGGPSLARFTAHICHRLLVDCGVYVSNAALACKSVVTNVAMEQPRSLGEFSSTAYREYCLATELMYNVSGTQYVIHQRAMPQ
jgi:hypothetical protein